LEKAEEVAEVGAPMTGGRAAFVVAVGVLLAAALGMHMAGWSIRHIGWNGRPMWELAPVADAGDRRGALSWWLFAIRLSPALMADKQLAGRIFRVRNLRRLGRIFSRTS